jgi:1L-myo-inositol 1-phosphate cytidylyltransferase / CDP-L-myo-inositol myo-inositolphosphotransferase
MTVKDDDRGAQSSISNRRPVGDERRLDSRTEMAAAPILVLLPAPLASLEAAGGAEGYGERMILGLSLIRRAVLAARRAGYGQVIVLSATPDAAAGAAEAGSWRSFAATLKSQPAAPLVIAPGAILAQTGWLERLREARIEPAAWAAIPNRIVIIAAGSALSALDALDEKGGAREMSAVESELERRFGPPAAVLPGVDPMTVETPADVGRAERRLMQSLVKDTDGFMARHVERPISLTISRVLAPTAITPNEMSVISIIVGLVGAPFFVSGRASLQTIGALLFLAHSILDGCDGELARLKFEESRWGGVLDFWGDNVVHAAIFACMGVGWSLTAGAGWPLLLGAAAVLGALGSAGLVYWRLMRGKDDGGALFTSVSADPGRPLARALDSASRRDFIYLVLLLALAGKSNWFLVLAALGAPIYFCLLVFLAAREGSSR